MVDWARITADVERALTLDAEARAGFLDTLAGQDEEAAVARLLQRARPATGFLATSAPGALPGDETLKSGTRIGPWQVEAHLGRGGMGDVYRANRADGLYDQTVALKLIQGLSPARAALFDAERRRLALMDHPGIARIIDGGAGADGRPYMAMDYVDGTPITEYAKERSLPRAARLALFRAVCEAVSHAHGKLILHRDIKSENVLVDRAGNPRLIDFGIASDLEDETRSGGPLTLATAAPEQLKGEPVSVQTDVFALGVLLHELLTGERPRRTRDGGMEADADTLANADLAAILSRALATPPAERYASAAALGEDVSAYMAKRPVSARQGGWLDAASKFLQRYPLASGLAAAVTVSLVAGLTTSLSFAAAASAEAERATTALEEAQANLERSEFFLERANLFQATQSAYADALQSMFGAGADVERQTRVLKERWQQAYELRQEDPENAAFLSYAIGRQFLFRNDYLTAIDILQPWIEEGYGPPVLVGYGRQMLAVAYMSIGREQEALPILRETEAWLASGFDAAAPDHIAAATQIAIITEEEADIRAAERLLQTGLETDHGSSINMYFWNQLSRMRQMRGDFAGAYDAMREVVAIIDSTPLMDVSGTDTGLLNLADFELWHTGNLDRAEDLALSVLDTAEQTKGESRETGLAHATLAQVLVSRGDYRSALSQINKALEITVRYTGEDAESALIMKLDRAEMLAELQDSQAGPALEYVQSQLDGERSSSRLLERAKLAEIYVVARLEGLDAARARYPQLAPNRDVISRNLRLNHLHERLTRMGIIEGQ